MPTVIAPCLVSTLSLWSDTFPLLIAVFLCIEQLITFIVIFKNRIPCSVPSSRTTAGTTTWRRLLQATASSLIFLSFLVTDFRPELHAFF